MKEFLSYNYLGHFSSEAHIVFQIKCQYFGKELAEWRKLFNCGDKKYFWGSKVAF